MICKANMQGRLAYCRHSIWLRLLHVASRNATLLSLQALLLKGLGLLLLQLLLSDLLTLVTRGGPLDHFHRVQVAVGGLAVHSLLDHRLGRVRGLTLLHLLLFPCVLLRSTADRVSCAAYCLCLPFI